MTTIRVAIIGTGAVAAEHYCEFHRLPDSGTEVVAVVDAVPGKAAAFAGRFDLDDAVSLDNLGAVLDAGRIDVAEICTPPTSHADVADVLLGAGVDILSEKPLAADLDAARSTIRSAADKGRALGVMQNYRYFPELAAARRLIERDALGGIRLIGAG